ncbi:MAG: right-handed parallel beta-helix repeat-containing protein [Sedimentisphaerales bacterium]|nr:right-handed parallel beta-helix repeat-containing protein [Sedimentisphaerales bacterium]
MKGLVVISGIVFAVVSMSFGATVTLQADGSGDFATIQAAIDASVDGDVIVLAPGTYTGDGNRDIDFLGKAITLQSAEPADPQVVAATVIDARGSEQDPHRGFFFHSGEGPDSLLLGLTITGGHTKLNIQQETYRGAGIRCQGASPTIERCVIENNTALGDYYNPHPSPGLLCLNEGGGIYCCAGSLARIKDCVIRGNTATRGGGISANASDITILRCILQDNHGDGYYGRGGAIRCAETNGTVIDNCLIFENTANYGAAIYCDDSGVILSFCTITRNESIYNVISYNTPRLTNCIVWGNTFLHNDIIWGNAVVEYSDVQSGYPGEGNMNLDPVFADPEALDFRLDRSSPCINTGDPFIVPETDATDLDGLARVVNGRADMGAYEVEYQGPVLWLDQDEYDFLAIQGGPNPDPQILTIRNLGIGPMDWDLVEECSWLELSSYGGICDDVESVSIIVLSEMLDGGNYSDFITIHTPGAQVPSRTIKIELYVEGPMMHLSEQDLYFRTDSGDPGLLEQTLTLSNSGSGTLAWQASRDCDWLNLVPDAGTLTVKQSQDILVRVDPTDLPDGRYECRLIFADPDALNSPIRMMAVLVINGESGGCYTGPDAGEWISVGRPECWCGPSQCYGDANNKWDPVGKGMYTVGPGDIEILVEGFGKAFGGNPSIQSWICADFNHRMDRIGKGFFRVGFEDINILLHYFATRGVPTDCNP